MVKDLIILKESLMQEIHDNRVKIADLKHDMIMIRAEAWKTAEGIADAKKDYVRSQVANLNNLIEILEADIELYYNQIIIINDKLEYMSDE